MTMMKSLTSRSYSELILLPTFIERYRYLRLGGRIGEQTFGYRRWLNQVLYHSGEWLAFHDDMVIRDNGCDLGIRGRDIMDSVLVHHLTPITYEDILLRRKYIFDPENVICTQLSTHNAIHYGDESLLLLDIVERKPNDTCPWKI